MGGVFAPPSSGSGGDANEANARIAADNQLSARINSEAAARLAGDASSLRLRAYEFNYGGNGSYQLPSTPNGLFMVLFLDGMQQSADAFTVDGRLLNLAGTSNYQTGMFLYSY